MLLCCTLRARAAQTVRHSAAGGARSRRAKRPAPRPTVRGSPRDRPKRASDVPARRTSTVLGGRAPILPRARAHFRHPWTAADPWATAAVAAVLYRWWRCAPAGLPPPPPRGISPVRAYYTRLRRRCVRECVRARVRTTCRFGKLFDYIIIIIYIIHTNNNNDILFASKTNSITRARNTHRVHYYFVFVAYDKNEVRKT